MRKNISFKSPEGAEFLSCLNGLRELFFVGRSSSDSLNIEHSLNIRRKTLDDFFTELIEMEGSGVVKDGDTIIIDQDTYIKKVTSLLEPNFFDDKSDIRMIIFWLENKFNESDLDLVTTAKRLLEKLRDKYPFHVYIGDKPRPKGDTFQRDSQVYAILIDGLHEAIVGLHEANVSLPEALQAFRI